MTNNKSTVLITGATGHIGNRVLRYALEHGYRVRAAVRSVEKAETLRSLPVLRDAKDLSFVIIPDFLAPNAFDEAVKGVEYIIHVASPLGTGTPEDGDYHKYYIEPAVRGTIGVYESAEKAGTVKRIVVTSSIIAIQPLSAVSSESDIVFGPDSRVPELDGPFDNNFIAYTASKIAAFNRSEAWVKAHKPGFDVINLHPSFVFGRDETTTSTKAFAKGTNSLVLGPALGQGYPGFESPPNNFNSVDQTALTHVLALNPAIKGNQSFINSSSGQDGFTWGEINDIVAKHFPEAVKDGTFPNSYKMGTTVAKLDVSKTEETFGFKHAGLEETIVPVFQHYLELLEKEKAAEK